MILLPFYLLVWAWLSAMLLLVLGENGEEVARYVFGDAGVCVQAVVASGVLGALMTGFYLRAWSDEVESGGRVHGV